MMKETLDFLLMWVDEDPEFYVDCQWKENTIFTSPCDYALYILLVSSR